MSVELSMTRRAVYARPYLVGVIGLLAAVAGTGPAGAQGVWLRMQAPAAAAAVTWAGASTRPLLTSS